MKKYNYAYRTEPMEHQARCFHKLYGLPFFGIFGEQGTGKTKMFIDIASNLYLEGKINAVLLIAPKGVHEQWFSSEIPKHSPCLFTAFLAESKSTKGYLNGRRKFIDFKTDRLKWLCVNIDIFSSDNFGYVVEFLEKHKAAVVVDESTVIKNPEAKRTYNVMYKLAKVVKGGRTGKVIQSLTPLSEYRAILTGMQVTNSPFDLWAPFSFLQHSFFGGNFFSFRARYGIEVSDKNKYSGKRFSRKITSGEIDKALSLFKSGYSAEQVGNLVGIGEKNAAYILANPSIRFPYKHLDELKEKIEPYSFTVTKKECLDLPPQIYQTVYVDMSVEQSRIYKDMVKNMLSEYSGKTLTVQNKLTQVMRLQQITSGFFPFEEIAFSEDLEDWYKAKKIVPIGKKNPKVEALKRSIDESGEEKIIVWCKFVAEIELLIEELEKAYPEKRVAAYYGGVSDKERLERKNAFLSGNVDIFIINVSMGIGHNFQGVCHNAKYFSGTYSLLDRKQSEDRIHRIGQKESVLYQDFVCKGTIDERIQEALKLKANLLDYFREHSIEDFIVGGVNG